MQSTPPGSLSCIKCMFFSSSAVILWNVSTTYTGIRGKAAGEGGVVLGRRVTPPSVSLACSAPGSQEGPDRKEAGPWPSRFPVSKAFHAVITSGDGVAALRVRSLNWSTSERTPWLLGATWGPEVESGGRVQGDSRPFSTQRASHKLGKQRMDPIKMIPQHHQSSCTFSSSAPTPFCSQEEGILAFIWEDANIAWAFQLGTWPDYSHRHLEHQSFHFYKMAFGCI